MQYWADVLADEAIVEISYSKPCHLVVVLALPVNDAKWDPWFTSEIKKKRKKHKQTNKKNNPKSTWKHLLESTSFIHLYITAMQTRQLKKSNDEMEHKT